MSVFLSRTNIAMLRMVVVTQDAVCTETENSWFSGSLYLTDTLAHFLFLPQTRCDEDLLKSKIKALEAQLQVCIKVRPQKIQLQL